MAHEQETFELYTKSTSNCQGVPLTAFRRLGPVYEDDEVEVRFQEGPDGGPDWLTVVGWTDLFFGKACPVSVVWVETHGERGVLVYGGNSGVRILDERFESTPGVDDHLPQGFGMPWIWIDAGDAGSDLPDAVLAVIGQEPEGV